MILEAGTDEELKRCLDKALLPAVGSVWTWDLGTTAGWLKVMSVDDAIHVQFNDDSVLNFTYTLSYWLEEMTALAGWRQL